MKYREIKLEGNKSILVDESADIEVKDYFIVEGKIEQCLSSSEADDLSIGSSYSKIVATINYSISLDVPMVILKDEVAKFSVSQQKNVYSEEDMMKDLLIKHDDLSVDYVIQSLKQKYVELEMKETIKECNYCSKTIREQSNGCTNIICYRQYLKTITTDRINGQLFAYIKH